MKRRIEAAAKAIFDVRDDPHDLDEWGDIDSTEREPFQCQSSAALAAADAVMFDDAAVERAGRTLYELSGHDGQWESIITELRDYWRTRARTVIAALRDAP